MGVVLGEEVRTKVGLGGHPGGDGTCGVGTRVGSVVCVAMQANVCVCVHAFVGMWKREIYSVCLCSMFNWHSM